MAGCHGFAGTTILTYSAKYQDDLKPASRIDEYRALSSAAKDGRRVPQWWATFLRGISRVLACQMRGSPTRREEDTPKRLSPLRRETKVRRRQLYRFVDVFGQLLTPRFQATPLIANFVQWSTVPDAWCPGPNRGPAPPRDPICLQSWQDP